MITFTKTPQKYTPANNPIIFQVSSDNTAIQFFNVQVQADDNSIIANLRLYTTPANRTSSYTDLSSILSNVVNYQLLPSANLIDATPAILQAYKLKVTEKLYGDAGIVDGSTSTSGLFYTWNAQIDRVSYSQYDYKNYVVTATGATANFLTNKPDLGFINATSNEYLSYLNDGVPATAKIITHNDSASNTFTTNVLSGITVGRVDVSPAALTRTFHIDFSNVKYYSVQLFNNSGVTKSSIRNFQYQSLGCKDSVEILFLNRLGGFDRCTFFNVRESVAVTKTSLTKTPFKIDNSGNYTDIQNGIFNTDTETIFVNTVNTYKAITDSLTDAQCYWLKELIESTKVYLKLPNGDFLPIHLNNSNYPVLRKKFSTSLMRLEIEFVANGDILNNPFDEFTNEFSSVFF
jgi:hypothetical protein